MKVPNHAMQLYFLTIIGVSFARLGNERSLNLFGGSNCVTVRGQIFEDSNENGIVDRGSDKTLSNIEISLSSCGDITSQKVNSNSTGGFQLFAPNEGCYQISVNVDPALGLVCPNPTEVEDVKCGHIINYKPYCIRLNPQNPAIKGKVSIKMDTDGNGITDADELDPLTSGGIVTFTPCYGDSSFTTSLAGDGSFEGSPPEGCYNVTVDPQSDQLDCGGGTEITSESGYITTVAFTCVPLTITTPTPSAPVGFIDGRAYMDNNDNGGVDDGEELSGGVVIISACDGFSPTRTEELAADGSFSMAIPKGCYNFLYTPEEDGLVCTKHDGIVVGSGFSHDLGFECIEKPTPPTSESGMITGQVFIDANGNSELDVDLDGTLSFGSVVIESCDENGSLDVTVDVNGEGKFERSVVPGCYTVMVPSDDLVCSSPSFVIKNEMTAQVRLLCISKTSVSVPAQSPPSGTISGTIFIDSNGNCSADPDEGLSTGTATVSACDGSSSVTLNLVDGIFTTGLVLEGCYDIAVDPNRADLVCGSGRGINLEGGYTLTWRTICQTQEQIALCNAGPSPTAAPQGNSGISNPSGAMFKGAVLMHSTNAPVSDGKVIISTCGEKSTVVQNLDLDAGGDFFSSLISPTCYNVAVVANGLNCGSTNDVILAFGETRILDFSCVAVARVMEKEGFINGVVLHTATDSIFTAGTVSIALNGKSPFIVPLNSEGRFTSGALPPGKFYHISILPSDGSKYSCSSGKVPLDPGKTVSLQAFCVGIG